MNNIDRLKKIVNTEIKYIKPIKLEELSKNLKNSDKFPDIKSSFEFPPKTIELVLEIFFDKRYEELNFFDIARLLQQLEQDSLLSKITNKLLFAKLLQELFNKNHSKKHIQNMILKIVTRILINRENHSFKNDLQINMNSKEFVFVGLCLKKNFQMIKKSIKNLNLRKVLRYYGIDKILSTLQNEYSNYLLNSLNNIEITDADLECYQNNLLLENNLDDLYFQLNKLISLIEQTNSSNNSYFDVILNKKLGNIEDESSKWYELIIPLLLIERYKRLKGLFEFQRFVQIAKYLSPDLESSNISRSGKTSDSDRLRHRSDFWSNYDSRFLSVSMWVSENDYRKMIIDKPVDLSNIKQLKNINNEMCLLEFKESKLLIIEFFRLRDNSQRIYSLVFEEEKTISIVKDILNKYDFNLDTYNQLKEMANYSINQDYCWQGWLDKFLRERNIFPNELILQGKNRFKGISYPYIEEIGLEQTRNEGLLNDRKVDFDAVIIKKKI